jgi:hypothetical protein
MHIRNIDNGVSPYKRYRSYSDHRWMSMIKCKSGVPIGTVTSIGFLLHPFYCNVTIIIDKETDLFNIFRYCFRNRSTQSCFIFNFFSTFAKSLRPSFNCSERRNFITINRMQFITDNFCFDVKCITHFNVKAKVFCIHLSYGMVSKFNLTWFCWIPWIYMNKSVADLGFCYCDISVSEHGSQIKRMEDDIGSKWWIFPKKIFQTTLAKKNHFLNRPHSNFFLCLVVSRFLEFHRSLNRISSTDFKFHREIFIRSGVTTFWIFGKSFPLSWKNRKHCNTRADEYSSMKFEICRRNSI